MDSNRLLRLARIRWSILAAVVLYIIAGFALSAFDISLAPWSGILIVGLGGAAWLLLGRRLSQREGAIGRTEAVRGPRAILTTLVGIIIGFAFVWEVLGFINHL